MAEEHVSRDQLKHVYHGTQYPWKGTTPDASYDRPFHVAADTDLPTDYAFDLGRGFEPEEDWRIMNEGHIKEFAVDPAAKVHFTDEEHFDGVLSEQEQDRVRRGRYDMTMFKGKLGIVYNPAVLKHTRDISYKEHTRSNPEDEMEWTHGEDWRDWIR